MKTLLLATATLGLIATPALAGESEVRTDSFSINDLNLDTAEGQKVLDRRINRAAKNVCRVADINTGTRLKSQEVQNCYARAKASARDQVAALYDARQLGG